MVDLLVKNGNKYDIYEIKSSRKLSESHINDVSFQRFVVSKVIDIGNVYVLTLNTEYENPGVIDLQKLVLKNEVSKQAIFNIPKIEQKIRDIESLLNKSEEPKAILKQACNDCGFLKYCHPQSKNPDSILNLNDMPFKSKLEFIKKGITTQKLLADYMAFGSIPEKDDQLELKFENLELIDTGEVKKFLGQLNYPLYFFDYEVFSHPYPFLTKTKPHQKIAFQYSLHIVDHEGENPRHVDFLKESFENPINEIATKLLKDIKPLGTIFVFQKNYEDYIFNDLLNRFPEFKDKFEAISKNTRDLFELYDKGYVFKEEIIKANDLHDLLKAYFPEEYKKNSDLLNLDFTSSEKWKNLELLNKKDEIVKLKEKLRLNSLGLYKLFKHFISEKRD
jgi:hypothetical protein